MIKLLFLFLLPFSVLFASTEEELDLLKNRVEQLEKKLSSSSQNIYEPRPGVSSYLDDNLTFGGFFEAGLIGITGPDTETQITNSSDYLGINLSALLGGKFRFVGQFVNLLSVSLQNPHNDPDGSPIDRREFTNFSINTILTQGYVEYSFNRLFNLQGGMGFVPFGFAAQLREPVLYVRRGGPQIVRTPSLISPLWNGLNLHGSSQLKKKSIGYNLYTFTPVTTPKFIGGGGRVWLSNDNEQVITGLSTQIGKDEEEAYQVLGADIRLDYFPYQIRSEVAHLFSKGQDTWSGYLEPGYFISGEEILLYVFGDYLFAPDNTTSAGLQRKPDPIQKWEYGAGVNWLPNSLTRIRLAATFADYVGYRATKKGVDRDFLAIDLSVGVAF